MRLTRLRGRVGATMISTVGALFIGLVLLTGSTALPEADAGSADQGDATNAVALVDEAGSARAARTPADVDSNGQPPRSPTQQPLTEIAAITDVLLEPVPPGQGGDGSASAEPGSPAGDSGLEAAVLSLVNQERAAAGCPTLRSDGPLTGLARAHSADMRDRNFFSHTNPSGQSPWDRAEAAGIGYLAAENIAAGQSSAAAVMAAWMGSPGHRSNILNCSLRTLGVGVAYGGSYGIYWTQDFGR